MNKQIIRRRLTNSEVILAHKHIEKTCAIPGAQPRTAERLAKEATEALGFEVPPDFVRRNAEALGITIRRRTRKDAGRAQRVQRLQEAVVFLIDTFLDEKQAAEWKEKLL
jgi:hypothetical protein